MKSSAELVTRITPEQRLLLRAVLLHGEPARHAFQEWRATVVIDDVDGVSQRLLPLLARRLGDVGPDDPVRSLIRGIYRHAWVRSHRLWRDALPVFVAMRDRGIPVILLKGAALLHAYGNDWGARPMFDIDALVRPEHAQGAFAVLEELGWTAEYDMTFDWVRSRSMTRRHGWGFLREDGRLDMHWHVLSESLGSHSDDAFWADAVPLETEGFTALTLAPPDLLLHLLVHGVSGMNAPTVQWISDAIHVARTYGADAMAERFVRQARAHGELAKVSEALAAIGMLVDPHELATIAARVSRERAAPVERLRRAGTAGEQLAQRGGRERPGAGRGRARDRPPRSRARDLLRALGRVRRIRPRAGGGAPRAPDHRFVRPRGGRSTEPRGDGRRARFHPARDARPVRRYRVGSRRGRRQHDAWRRGAPGAPARAGAPAGRPRMRDHPHAEHPRRSRCMRTKCSLRVQISRRSTPPWGSRFPACWLRPQRHSRSPSGVLRSGPLSGRGAANLRLERVRVRAQGTG